MRRNKGLNGSERCNNLPESQIKVNEEIVTGICNM